MQKTVNYNVKGTFCKAASKVLSVNMLQNGCQLLAASTVKAWKAATNQRFAPCLSALFDVSFLLFPKTS